MTFSGFPAAGIQFLSDLAENNNKAWFEANKQVYKQALEGPAVNFVMELGERLRPTFPDLKADPRTNGGGSLLRIYRDVRFSKDKTPYKTNVSALLWEGEGKKNLNPGMGFQLTAHSMGLMTGMHGLPKDHLARFREAIADDELGREAEAIVTEIQGLAGYRVGGAHYKRVPRGYDADHPRAELLKYAAFYAYPPEVSIADVQTPAVVDICVAHFETLAPLHRWLVKALG